MESSRKYDTLIIGAGPAGMAAAKELCKAKEGFAIVEKSNSVGGLSKTHIIHECDLEFRTDIGPHRFYSEKSLHAILENLPQNRWINVKRQTRQYINGKFYDYPINAKQAFRNLGPLNVIKILADYFFAILLYQVLHKPVNNFYDYAIANFGKTLAAFNVINYTEKIWGLSTKELHADWAKKRITGLSLIVFIKNILNKTLRKGRGVNPKNLIETFPYPELGSSQIYESIKEQIEHARYSIFFNSQPTSIIHEKNHIVAAEVKTDDKCIKTSFDYLIESVHIVDFLKLLDPPPPEYVCSAAKKLRYRSQVYLFITLDKDKITTDQWIYFPDPDIPFARISEMKNFSSKMSPQNKTSIFVEYFCNEDDKLYHLTKEELFELTVPILEKYGFFKRSEVRYYYRFQGYRDYPIYDITYESNLNIIKNYLDSFDNLFYIGRPGRFEYTSQEQSMEMGIQAARRIIDLKKDMNLAHIKK